jgi:DNA-binding NarL/FixJ family response regulator
VVAALPTILFVDDEPAVLAGLRNALRTRRSQWEMVFANGGAEAIDVVERDEVAVVVSDLRMPGVDGSDVLRRVSQVRPTTIRLLLTGFGDPDAMARVRPWCQLVLAKPMSARDVAAVVVRACQIHTLVTEAGAAELAERFRTSVPPPTFATLAALRCHDKVDPATIAAILDREPAIAEQLLALARSSAFRCARPPATTRELALCIDLDALALLALAAHLFVSAPELLDRACTIAMAARKAAEDPELAYEAFASGLLHDVGKLVDPARHHVIGAQLLGRCGLPLTVLETIATPPSS